MSCPFKRAFDRIFADSEDEGNQPAKRQTCAEQHARTSSSAVPPSQLVVARAPDAPAPIVIDEDETVTTIVIDDTDTLATVDDWRRYEVPLDPNNLWWTWNAGIIDLTRLWADCKPNRSEGFLLNLTCRRARWIIDGRRCMFKVGMTTNIGVRWRGYLKHSGWKPSHLFLLHTVKNRVAAGYVEAAIIRELRHIEPACDNINGLTKDAGGTGQRAPALSDAVYYAYLGVRPTCE